MDRNFITGIVLIVLILVGSFIFQHKTAPPVPPKQNTVTLHKDSAAAKTVAADTARTKTDSVAAANVPADWAGFAHGQNQEITLENSRLKIKIATKGGRVSYAELKEYKTFDGHPLIMQDETSGKMNFYISTAGSPINTEDLYFTPVNQSANAVTMAVTLPDGKAIRQTYQLPQDSFVVHYQLNLAGMDKVIPQKDAYIDMNWQAGMLRNEKDSQISYRNMTVFYKHHDETPDELSETKESKKMDKIETDWISYKQQFFCQALIADSKPFSSYDLTSENGTGRYMKQFTSGLTMDYKHLPNESYNMRMYYGPLHYATLRDMHLELERQIPLGWGFFLTSWVNRFVVIPVFNILRGFNLNIGIIIILLTVYIKLIVMPFTYKSYLSTAKMRILKPELDELKAKIGNDVAKMQTEQMKLYRKAGVSPFGGCLPLLLQFPILIAMFRFFPSSIELRQQSFLWAKDLSTYDSIATLPFNIPFYGNHVSLFTLLMTISTLIYTRLNNSLSTQQAEMKWMSYIMPIMFLGFFNQYSAGLSLYYFCFNILTFLQQYLFKIFINDKKLKAQIEENKKKPQSGKKSKLQQRLEDLQKQQQMQQRNRGGRK